MNLLKARIGGIVGSVFEIIIGVLLLVNPVGFTSGIILGTGIVMVIIGLISTVKYFITGVETASKEQSLFKGLLFLMIGAFCVLKNDWFIATFPVLTIIYGVMTIVGGLLKVQWTFDSIRKKEERWFLPAISALISIICGAVIIGSPFTTTAVLWIFTGITIIVEAVFDLAATLFSRKKI